MDKRVLINRILSEAEMWSKLLDKVDKERMEEPGATGDWSFKDVVAHISAWRARTLSRLEAARRDQMPSSAFWPAGWDEDNDDDLEKINRWIYEQNRDRSLEDVLNESRQQFQEMSEAVNAIPESDLFDPQRFEWMEGKPLANLVDFNHFHEEHNSDLRRWLA